jgi:hypothetical protein
MRRIGAIAIILLTLACEPAGPPDLGTSTDTTETGSGTSSDTGDGDGDPGVYGWCCDCDLVPMGGPPVCQPSYAATCGEALVWCEVEQDCYPLCLDPACAGAGC